MILHCTKKVLKHLHFGWWQATQEWGFTLKEELCLPWVSLLHFSMLCQLNILQERVNPTTGSEVLNMYLGSWHHLWVSSANCVSLCGQILASKVLEFMAIYFELENSSHEEWRKMLLPLRQPFYHPKGECWPRIPVNRTFYTWYCYWFGLSICDLGLW